MPAYGNSVGMDKGYDADAAIPKYRAVKGGASAESVAPVVANTDRCRGVTLFAVTGAELLRGKGASVRRLGIVEWEAGGNIAKDAEVTIDASGRCVTAVSGNRVYGTADQATTNGVGDIIAVAVDFLSAPVKP